MPPGVRLHTQARIHRHGRRLRYNPMHSHLTIITLAVNERDDHLWEIPFNPNSSRRTNLILTSPIRD